MSIFDRFPRTKIDIVAPDGTLRCSTAGIITEHEVQIPDTSIDVEPGDEVRRPLPNGKEEVYLVENAVFHERFHQIQAHYSLKIRRKGYFPRHTGGHYIHVAGPNARVNLASTDNSTNIVNSGSVFGDLMAAIEKGVADPSDKATLLGAADQMQKAADPSLRLDAYQRLIAAAANHMTIIAPFLPALTQAIGLPT